MADHEKGDSVAVDTVESATESEDSEETETSSEEEEEGEESFEEYTESGGEETTPAAAAAADDDDDEAPAKPESQTQVRALIIHSVTYRVAPKNKPLQIH